MLNISRITVSIYLGRVSRSSDGQACVFPGGFTQTATDLELTTIPRTGPVDCAAARPADAAAQGNAARIAGAFSSAGSQKGTAAGPDDSQAQTPHLLRLIVGEPNIADVLFVVGTTGAALLAVVNRPFPHVSSLSCSDHCVGSCETRVTGGPEAADSPATKRLQIPLCS